MISKKENKFNSCAAFAETALDKVGAGDAMLSITALCLKNKFSRDLSLLIGSLAAAQSTETFGNKHRLLYHFLVVKKFLSAFPFKFQIVSAYRERARGLQTANFEDALEIERGWKLLFFH